jgi:hypothetical protein
MPDRILVTKNAAIIKFVHYDHRMDKLSPHKFWQFFQKQSRFSAKEFTELFSRYCLSAYTGLEFKEFTINE